MSIALIVLILVALMPYALAGVGGYFKAKQFGKADNHNPREQTANLTGPGARAYAAQANSWEALAFYSAVIVVVFASGVSLSALTIPALIFAASRIIYPVAYIADLPMLRSSMFGVGLFSCLYMLYLAF